VWEYHPINNLLSFVKSKSQNSEIQQNYSYTNFINSKNTLDNHIKVNIDEELTNLINYQQWYSANAKVIQTSDEMLKTLLNINK
jgi:flagellar hook-associated protein 1 FlgK